MDKKLLIIEALIGLLIIPIIVGGVTLIKTWQIADKAVTSKKIAPSSIYRDKIADKSVTTSKITAKAINTYKLANGAVTQDKIDLDTWCTLHLGYRDQKIFDIPSIASQDCYVYAFTSSHDVNMMNTVMANPIEVTGGVEDLDLVWSAFVSSPSTDELSIRICNPTSGALDPASQSWMIRHWQNY